MMTLVPVLLGLAIVALGVRTIWLREGKYGDIDSHWVVEGFPAILLGLAEIAAGFYMIFHNS